MKLSGSYKDIKRYSKAVDLLKVQCKNCGRKTPFFSRTDRVICTWCRNYIYKNEQVEFKYKMKEVMRNENKRVQKDDKRNET